MDAGLKGTLLLLLSFILPRMLMASPDKCSGQSFPIGHEHFFKVTGDGAATVKDATKGKILVEITRDGKHFLSVHDLLTSETTEVEMPNGYKDGYKHEYQDFPGAGALEHLKPGVVALKTADGKWNTLITIPSYRVGCILEDKRLVVRDPCVGLCLQVNIPSARTLDQESEKRLGEFISANRCAMDFDPKLWDAETPVPTSNSLSRELAYKFLLRFQKPGGFEPGLHLPALLAILKSDLLSREPELVADALENVMHTSNELYAHIVRMPGMAEKLQELKPKVSKAFCRSEKENVAILKSVAGYVENLIAKNPDATTLADWSSLQPLARTLDKLNPRQKEKYLNAIADSMAMGAKQWYKRASLSTFHYLSKNALKPLFGLKKDKLTELAMMHSGSKVKGRIFSSDAMDSSIYLDIFGFYYREAPEINVSDLSPSKSLTKSFSWQAGDERYSAKVTVSRREVALQLPDGNSPDYAGMWKDGKLTGIILAGRNLEKKRGNVLDRYGDYFVSQGFEFVDSEQDGIVDVQEFLSGIITSNEVDYLFKEAHFMSDSRNLIWHDKQARLAKAVKDLPDGKQEVVYLLYPVSNKVGESGTFSVSNSDFGKWIRSRDRQLVLVDTSCWSIEESANLAFEAKSGLLAQIGSKDKTDSFSNSEKNPFRSILDGIRESESYAEMRKEMPKKDQGLLLPGEPEWLNLITMNSSSVYVKDEIFDSAGRPYKLMEHVH